MPGRTHTTEKFSGGTTADLECDRSTQGGGFSAKCNVDAVWICGDFSLTEKADQG